MAGLGEAHPPADRGGPLPGLRVIDLSSVVMGPWATHILADYGADVIKVEPPEGDIIRSVGPALHEGMGPVFLHSGRSIDINRSGLLSPPRTLNRTTDKNAEKITSVQREVCSRERLRQFR
jgi:hypothetical protein